MTQNVSAVAFNKAGTSALDDLITAWRSPVPDNIKVDYGKKQQTHKHAADKETDWIADAE